MVNQNFLKHFRLRSTPRYVKCIEKEKEKNEEHTFVKWQFNSKAI